MVNNIQFLPDEIVNTFVCDVCFNSKGFIKGYYNLFLFFCKIFVCVAINGFKQLWVVW